MKIRLTGNPITSYGQFKAGDILEDNKYPIAFLDHLVDQCHAAERLDIKTKVDTDYEVKKNNQSTPSLQPDKASQNKTSRARVRKQKSSQ